MKLAYADPPYPGQAKRHYGNHPDYDGEVDHAELIGRLEAFDGWALSTSMTALRDVLSFAPPTAVVASWHVTNGMPAGHLGWWHHYSWEPVIVSPARARPEVRNVLVCPNNATFQAPGITGAKPPFFCLWVFDLLGAEPDDTLEDLFPGSGAVARAWERFTQQQRIPLAPARPGQSDRAKARAATGASFDPFGFVPLLQALRRETTNPCMFGGFGVKGRTGATPERLLLAERVRVRHERGLVFQRIADELGISRSYAGELYDDPSGAKGRARKDAYSGVCETCGAATSGNNGRANAPALCSKCFSDQRSELKAWTRETVIDAIQRFAERNGRPPIADEWRQTDHVFGYPARTLVYQTKNHPTAPFPRWADAIEAAGFERPTTGRRTLMPERRGYVVLNEFEPGVWKELGTLNESSGIVALNKALNGNEPTGRFVAIPGRYFQPKALRPTTAYEFVDG